MPSSCSKSAGRRRIGAQRREILEEDAAKAGRKEKIAAGQLEPPAADQSNSATSLRRS
jgi:hypothetical protein